MEKLPLTTRQREILEYMGSFTRESGYPPTVREICSATGLRSPRSVSQHLQSLERKGYIQRGRDKSRAIRFLHRPDSLGLAGADAVVFVADSQKPMARENLTAFENMKVNLLANRLVPEKVPLVLQYNKQDLDGLIPRAELDRALNSWGRKAFPAVAARGRPSGPRSSAPGRARRAG